MVNTGQVVGSAFSLTVGDVLNCSVQDALSYLWTSLDDDHAVTYGQTLSITQPGIFNYSCTAFVECYTWGYDCAGGFFHCDRVKSEGKVFCPLSKNMSGFATGCTLIHWCNNSPNVRKNFLSMLCNMIIEVVCWSTNVTIDRYNVSLLPLHLQLTKARYNEIISAYDAVWTALPSLPINS